MIKLKTKYEIYYVKWDDACANAKWHDIYEIKDWLTHNQYIIETVGYLIAEDQHAIYLAAGHVPETKTAEEQFNLLQRIPKNWIMEKRKLK